MRRDDLIDRRKTIAQLEAIIANHHGQLDAARPDIVQCLKETLEEGRKLAETRLLKDGLGLKCAQRLSMMMDQLIAIMCEMARSHGAAFATIAPDNDLAILAVGGYGRGTLAPGSDIDLLFLLPKGSDRRGEQLTQYVLYILWDLGLKVGHAVRTTQECVEKANSDTTIATTLLEMRPLWGSKALGQKLKEAFHSQVVAGSSSAYIEAKLAERTDRLSKNGTARYMVEPNVKEGKGGLRDINTLFWIAQYHYGITYARELVKLGVLTQNEFSRFGKASNFLWAVRCHMHFESRRAEEHLHFEIQREIAKRLGYTDRDGQRGVERFMKHYFLVAKDVGDLTRIICAALELEEAKTVPLLGAMLGRVTRRQKPIKGSDFMIENGRICVADETVFERDPVNFIRMFHLADKHSLHYHPATLKLVSRSLRLIDRKVQNDPEANRLFVDLLSSPNNPEINLRRMNEAGVLGKFVPEFGKIVAMMQFSMYHSYTVDEHTIRAVGVLAGIESKALQDEHPLAARLIGDMAAHRRVLYVALFLHDIAKGRKEDHSIAGAKVARKLCPRFGFSKAETATIAWLVQEHLTMSTVAQSRDLSDRKTIDDFATVVQSREQLKLLLFLTICDIRAVGPGVWNGWKGQLLRTLYNETELLLTGGFSAQARDARAAQARSALMAALDDWPDQQRLKYAALFYDNYLLSVPLETQLRHVAFMRQADETKTRLTSTARTHHFQGITEITVLAPDHPRLLSAIFAACVGAGANIVDAHIFTTTDGRALDTILINRAFDQDEDEYRRGRKIGQLIEDVLSGKASLPETLQRQKKRRGTAAFSVEPKVQIHNDLSNRFSVIEVECLDRAGLLSGITAKMSALSLDIKSAQITTFGEKVVDNFYVTDLVGSKIDSAPRQKKIINALLDVVDPQPLPPKPKKAS